MDRSSTRSAKAEAIQLISTPKLDMLLFFPIRTWYSDLVQKALWHLKTVSLSKVQPNGVVKNDNMVGKSLHKNHNAP